MTAPARVAALRLGRFRSWDAAALRADGRPVALWGPNGAGKTNLLEAVSLLSPGRGLRRARAEELARRGAQDAGWRLRATLAGPDGAREIALTGPPGGGGRRVELDGKPVSQTALGALLGVLWLTPAMDRLWIEGAEGRRRFLDRAALSFTPGHAEAALDYERAMRERNRLLRDAADQGRWLDALEARMATAGMALARARVAAVARLNAAQPDAGPLFPRAEVAIVGDMESRVAQTAAAGADGEPGAVAIMEEFRLTLGRGRRADAAAGRALAGPHRSDLTAVYLAKGAEARLCSTGEQKALLLGLTLANARAAAQASGAAPVLLLDEVAAHLDESRRAALFEAILALGAQAWMTGTERAVFAPLGARAQGFAVAEGPGGSTLTEERPDA